MNQSQLNTYQTEVTSISYSMTDDELMAALQEVLPDDELEFVISKKSKGKPSIEGTKNNVVGHVNENAPIEVFGPCAEQLGDEIIDDIILDSVDGSVGVASTKDNQLNMIDIEHNPYEQINHDNEDLWRKEGRNTQSDRLPPGRYCTICCHEYTSRASFLRHYHEKHSVTFSCACGRTFARKKNLVRHQDVCPLRCSATTVGSADTIQATTTSSNMIASQPADIVASPIKPKYVKNNRSIAEKLKSLQQQYAMLAAEHHKLKVEHIVSLSESQHLQDDNKMLRSLLESTQSCINHSNSCEPVVITSADSTSVG